MILILGKDANDIIFLKASMKIDTSETIRFGIETHVGTLAGKKIVLSFTGQSMMMASAITNQLFLKYDPYMVISIGNVSAHSSSLDQKDIVLINRVYLGDVNLDANGTLNLGQINSMPLYFNSVEDYMSIIENVNEVSGFNTLSRTNLISTNTFYKDKDRASDLVKARYAHIEGSLCFDNEMGGVVTACYLNDLPWIAIKVVNYCIGNNQQLLNHIRKGVETEPEVGKLIIELFTELLNAVE